jgi:hypothetical protein
MAFRVNRTYPKIVRNRKQRMARRRAVEALGSLVVDDSIPDAELRRDIFARLPRTDLEQSVEGCRCLLSLVSVLSSGLYRA